MPSRGPAALEVRLTDHDRGELQAWVDAGAGSDLGTRARIVLATADGSSNADAARRLGISVPTVRKWRRRFVEDGLEGLLDRRVHEDGDVGRRASARPVLGDGRLWEALTERLREAILDGSTPPGSRLVESALAEEFGTSRGPVREALRELAREGLVVELTHRAAVVCTPTARDLTEIYEARRGLELVAGEAACAHADDAQIVALASDLDAFEGAWAAKATFIEAAEHDLAFHRHLVALGGNRRIDAMYDQLLAQTMVLLRTADASAPALRQPMRRSAHRDILAALKRRDAPRLRRVTDTHYAYALERLLGTMP